MTQEFENERPTIRVMSDQLANQIAAGEVVERPASVVKELVENSLDAEATRVEVEIEEGGRGLVRVTDDGIGLTREEALLAIKRHATSKLVSVDDLRAIGTLGFRGEALPSIVSVSRFEIESRVRGNVEGIRVVASGDAPIVCESAGVPPGTRISVSDLFFNVPARRKFLRATRTEASRVSAAMTRFALGYPHVRFRLVHGGRKVLDVTPERTLLHRAHGVLGKKVAGRLHPVKLSMGVEVEGLISDPGLHRVNADGMYTYVNGRFIRDRLVQHAITSAYGNLLDRGRYPYVVLFIRVPPTDLDVNVHPTKAEVRFVRSGEVHETIVRAIRMTLADAPWLTTDESGQIVSTVSGVGADDRVQTMAIPRTMSLPGIAAEGTPTYAPGSPQDGGPATVPSAPLGTVLRELEVRDELPPAPAAFAGARGGAHPAPGAACPTPGGPAHTAPPMYAPGDANAPGFFSRMRYVGQVKRTYLICQTPEALHVIDQHAAHERVTYERIRKAYFDGKMPMQNLLLPIQLDVSAEEVEAVEANEENLLRMGFDAVRFGERTVSVRAIPIVLANARVNDLVQDLVAELYDHGKPRSLEDRIDAVAARLACHGSVRGGDAMTPQEVHELMKQLDEVDFRANCPHGRPVVVTHTFDQVERWFERS